MEQDLQAKVDAMIIEKKKFFGYDINLNSAPQLKKELFGGMFNFEPLAFTETNQPSCDKKALDLMIEKYGIANYSFWESMSKKEAKTPLCELPFTIQTSVFLVRIIMSIIHYIS